MKNTTNSLVNTNRIHWAWHSLILTAAILVLVVIFSDKELIKYWFFADDHISDEKLSNSLFFFRFVLIVMSEGCLILWLLRKVIVNDWQRAAARWREIPFHVDTSAIIPLIRSSSFQRILWLLLPIWTVGVVISLIPGYEAWAANLTRGNGLSENLTVIFYLFSGLVALKLLHPLFGRNAPGGLLRWWLAGLAIGCLFIAAEEANWGDAYFHLKAGDFIRAVNSQNDVSFHNVPLPFIGACWANDLSHVIAICGGVLLPLFIWLSEFSRRLMLALEVPLPPWVSQAYFFVAAIIPQDHVIKLQRVNIPSELREITLAFGVAIWLWCLMQNHPKWSERKIIRSSSTNETQDPINTELATKNIRL